LHSNLPIQSFFTRAGFGSCFAFNYLPFRVLIIMAKDVIQTRDVYIGSEDATVTLVAYIDYESEECDRLNILLKELLIKYEGKIRLNFRHFPMANIHQKSMKAAEAAVAAAQENLFWQMHNLLFQNRKRLGTISLKEYAKEAGVQNKRYLDELVNGIYAWQVREDLLDALDKGVRYAPTVFLNGKPVEKALTFETLSAKIDDLLIRE
jgi:protein-disulfide isomerase